MRSESVVPSKIEERPLPFSPAIRSGDLVFVSGQASVDQRGQIVADSFEREMRRAMENLRLVLTAAGGELRDAVQVRAYVHDADDLPKFKCALSRVLQQTVSGAHDDHELFGSGLIRDRRSRSHRAVAQLRPGAKPAGGHVG